jgi:hypothetical protein
MDIGNIVRPNFIDQQGRQASRKYMAYSSTYGLRVAMGWIASDQVQELRASRQQIDNRTEISVVAQSPVSDIMNATNIEGINVEIDFDRAEQRGADLPWSDIQSLLGKPETVYDLPIQRLVIRFSDESFTQAWTDKIEDAIDDPNFPTDWIESPFYAVLESSRPDNDARQKVKNDHEDRYFLPKSNKTSNGKQGLGWTPRILDLQSVWSHRGWTERDDQRLEAWSGRQSGGNWTPKRLEQRLMNFFEPDMQYTGMLRDSDLMNRWRDVMSQGSHDYTSFKTFEWEDEEEWMLQN